jgi:4'-phosphopantetheinyl transferase
MELLPAHTVHVWYVLVPPEPEADLDARYHALLAPEERKRHARFMQEKDRRQFLWGKALVRTVLSRYHLLPPEAWTFGTNRFGKPTVDHAPADFGLRFNLSHTPGLVACALTRGLDVGIDVENFDRTVTLEIARRFFAPAEVAYLERLPVDRRQHAFFVFWTLKEAYVKARGMGLSLPLEQFAFELTNPQAPQITFDPAMREDPAGWRFFLPDVPSPCHRMAVAVQCPAGAEIGVVARQFDEIA